MSYPLSSQVQCIIWKHQGHAKSWLNCMIFVAKIAINETTVLEIKVTIRPFRSSLTTYLSRLMEVKESAKSVMHVQSFCFSLVKAIAFYFLLSVVILGEA